MQSTLHFSLAADTEEIGNGTHADLLEPEKDLLVRGPENRRGNAWKDAKADAEAEGKILLKADVYDQVKRMSANVLRDQACAELLTAEDRICEASIFWKHERTGLEVRVRPDVYVPSLGIIGDVKTTVSSHPRKFARQSMSLGYQSRPLFTL